MNWPLIVALLLLALVYLPAGVFYITALAYRVSRETREEADYLRRRFECRLSGLFPGTR